MQAVSIPGGQPGSREGSEAAQGPGAAAPGGEGRSARHHLGAAGQAEHLSRGFLCGDWDQCK